MYIYSADNLVDARSIMRDSRAYSTLSGSFYSLIISITINKTLPFTANGSSNPWVTMA